MVKPLASICVSLLLIGGNADQTGDDEGRLLIRNVAISDAFIVFSYAGDLWKVGRTGGAAEPLTNGPEDDDYPVLSPDGGSVAFSRRGADDWNVYIVGLSGGEPTQLTYNPEADIARGWNATGDSILFMSHRDEERVFRLYLIGRDGGFPNPLPLPRAWDGAFPPSGERIAYVPHALADEAGHSRWLHYRGGLNSTISIVDLSAGQSEEVPREDSRDLSPMWIGEILYFLSDRSGTFNLHSYEPQTRQIEQLTEFAPYGVEAAAAGGGAIAFVQGGQIRVFDPSSGTVETLPVSVEPGRSELEPRTVRGTRWIESGSISSDGRKAVFGMRGEIVSFDTETGAYENLTQTSGAAERNPRISPDGHWIAYFSDESGEYQLQVRSTGEEQPLRKIPVELKPTYYRELTWSPDSKRLAFSDSELTLWVADIETLGARRITTSNNPFQDDYQPAWSPDGTWLAYSRFESNGQRAIHLYEVVRGRRLQVTDAQANAEHPAFDPSGRYLFFVAGNNASLGEFGWSLLSGELLRPFVSRRLQAVVLREGLPSPILPIIAAPHPEADSLTAFPAARPPQTREELRRGPPPRRPRETGSPQEGSGRTVISVGGLRDRTIPLPVPAADYGVIVPAAPGVFYVVSREWPTSISIGARPKRSIYRYRLHDLERPEKLITDVDDFAISTDGTRILYRRGDEWFLIRAAEALEFEALPLALDSVELTIDPAAEWRQIYEEVWRLVEDHLYDPNHHGENLDALREHYTAYLPSIARREDLNALLGRALGHLSVSHLSLSGGDTRPPTGESSRIGLLGADYEIDQGLYRIARTLRSGPTSSGNPLLQAPLDQPGVYVDVGDYLLAVDGARVTADRNLYSYFAGTALRPTKITVGPSPTGEDARTYTVVPLPGENTLRRWNWATRNRRAVEEESQGILGYVYVPNFGPRSLEIVLQQVLEHSDKRGLIIDQRFAGGGITSDFLIEVLRRRPLYYYMFRYGEDVAVPTNPLPNAKVLLINETNGSAAETFALMFKLAHVGRVIGTRTMGAGIGPHGFTPELIDGGRVRVPTRAAFNPAGSWDIENDGVEPDIEVKTTLVDWWEGRDPQLGTAIRTVLRLIVDNPPLEVLRPEYPVHK